MKLKLYLLILIISGLLSGFSAQAQVSGHRGGLLVLKTDLMSPLLDWGAHGGLEVVAFRRMSFTADYNWQREYLTGNYFALMANRQYGDDALLRAHTISLGLRFYTNRAIPAPHGTYLGLKVGVSRYSIEGVIDDSQNLQSYQFSYGPLAAGSFGFVYGHQWVLLTRMTIDLGFSFQYNLLKDVSVIEVNELYNGISGTVDVSDFSQKYGGNAYNYNGIQGGIGFGLHLAVGLIVP
ncbi:MAG: DUF3575 domain-containing protein [Cytophagales bacterium]|nr:DUF3575 domain-containing protein [Cytophagales bacterium]